MLITLGFMKLDESFTQSTFRFQRFKSSFQLRRHQTL